MGQVSPQKQDTREGLTYCTAWPNNTFKKRQQFFILLYMQLQNKRIVCLIIHRKKDIIDELCQWVSLRRKED